MYSNKEPLVIEGTDGSGATIPGFDSPPYRVFDPVSQERLTSYIHGRRDAERALTMIGKALNRAVSREDEGYPKTTSLQRKLDFMRDTMLRKQGNCSTIPRAAIACAVDADDLARIYGSLKATYPEIEPMWVLIKEGPYGRYTRFLMRARYFFAYRPDPGVGTHYWTSLPDHSALIKYLEERGLCPWQT